MKLIFIRFVCALIFTLNAVSILSAATVPAPSLYPSQGTYGHPVAVFIHQPCLRFSPRSWFRTRVRVTIDGTEPTENSPEYILPFVIADTTLVRARAFCEGLQPSSEVQALYTINYNRVAARPQLSLAPGLYNNHITVSLSSTTPGAIIRYTTNGQMPHICSKQYTGPISITRGTQIRAFASKRGLWPSGITYGKYELKAGAVTIHPGSDLYYDPPSINLTSATEGAIIRYSTDGSPVSTASPVYSAPFVLATSGTVQAVAYKEGYLTSESSSKSFELKIAPITIDKPSGDYADAITVTPVTTTANAIIHMTNTGEEPTEASPIVTAPILVDTDSTLSFKAYKNGWTASDITSVTYRVAHDTAPPILLPISGTYTDEQVATINSATSGAAIYFTTDGSEPTTNSLLYSGPFPVTQSTTIKARAIRPGWNASEVTQSIITLQVPKPTISQSTGIYINAFEVLVGGLPNETVARYTFDGTAPDSTSTLFSDKLTIDQIRSLQVRSFRDGWVPSEVVMAEYTMQVAPITLLPESPASNIGKIDVTATSLTAEVLFRYTMDGSDPLGESFTTTHVIPVSSSATVSVVGVRPGFKPSLIATGTYTITPIVSFSKPVHYVKEDGVAVTVEVGLSSVAGYDISIPYRTVMPEAILISATEADDYTVQNSVVHIPAGSQSGTITLNIIDDHIQEAPEVILLELQAADRVVLGDQPQTKLVIIDNEAQPNVAFATASTVVSETVATIDIPITLSNPSQMPVTVRVQVVGGTAKKNDDYEIAISSVFFSPLQTTAFVRVTLIDDQIPEIPETIQLRLSSQTNASLGEQREHLLTLTSNEHPLVSLDWQLIARELVVEFNTNPVMASRVYALLSLAQYRAARAADDSNRPLVVATASAEALSRLYPSRANNMQSRLISQIGSTTWPGSPTDSDQSNSSIGRSIARQVIEAASSDGAETRWAGIVPVGPGYWYSSWTYAKPPLLPSWSKVRPWFLTSGSQFRPGPPPAFGSPAFLAALEEVRTIADNRTEEQLTIAGKWADGPGTATPPGHWNEIASTLIANNNLNELQAVHILALLNAAQMDAGIATWDAKYTYWLIRPYQADLAISSPPGQPNFPSYTSGHSGFSGAASTVLAAFFPDSADMLHTFAEEAAASRLYGGIHYRFDNDVGLILGRNVGNYALQHGVDGTWRTDSNPEIVIVSPQPGKLLTGGQQPEFTGIIRLQGTAQSIATVHAIFSDQSNDHNTPINITPNSTSGEWQFSVPMTTTLGDGIYTLTLQVTDDLGATGTGMVTIGLDSDGPPIITITAPEDHKLLNSSGATSIVGLVNQNLASLTINGTPISFSSNGMGVNFSQTMTVEPT